MLHAVLHPVRINRNHKPTILDAQEDFLIHIKTINDLMPTIVSLTGNIQPKIIAVGPDLQNLSEFYTYCDGVRYKSTHFARSLDVIIKLSYVFNIKYSEKSKLAWIFLEQYFFKLKSEEFSVVTNLVNKVKQKIN